MIDLLQEIKDYIENFNQQYGVNFDIDSIRVEFSKEYKIEGIKDIGQWEKLKANSKIVNELKSRLADNKITKVYKLKNQNIYYYNSKEKNYRVATMVIFGLKQYHKEPPSRELITKLLNILYSPRAKLKQNIDVCLDLDVKPKVDNLKDYAPIRFFLRLKDRVIPTDTFYINTLRLLGIEKIVIYDKQFKNKLGFPCWRIEAKMILHNHKDIFLPLHEFKALIDLTKENP